MKVSSCNSGDSWKKELNEIGSLTAHNFSKSSKFVNFQMWGIVFHIFEEFKTHFPKKAWKNAIF